MKSQMFLGDRVALYPGNCIDVLAELPENSVDSCVCDPPYHLTSIVKRFGSSGAAEAKDGPTGAYKRASAGFMGKQWDGGDIAFQPATWGAVLRVLKPGAYLVAFSGTRTYHRMACAIEDAGFDIRDQLAWAYGSGFPKSHNLGDGRGTALKPAWEPICLARKPLEGTNAENLAKWGTAGLNIDACRIGEEPRYNPSASANEIYGQFKGAEQAGRVAVGRWPANLVHDGSPEVLEGFPETGPANGEREASVGRAHPGYERPGKSMFTHKPDFSGVTDTGGSAARYFYTAKADAEDRLGSKHPTVKPVDLMQWLCRLVTPPGGTLIDPFAGTGTTGEAAFREGFHAVLIEREAEYQADIARRMELSENPTKRSAVARSKNNLQGAEGTPLFDRHPAYTVGDDGASD